MVRIIISSDVDILNKVASFKQVEKFDKVASIHIFSGINLQTIDPKTFKRTEPYALFIGTGDYGKAGKIDMFNVYGEHPMITESNALPTVTLDTLVQQNIPIIGKEPRAGEKQPYQDISGLYKQAQTKKIKQGKHGCLMALVPHELAQEIVAWGVVNIPDAALYIDGDAFGRELEIHCTIKYGLISDDAKTARRIFNKHQPFKAKLGKVKHFEPDVEWGEFDVVTVEIESDDLKQMNKEVCDKLECTEGLVSDDYKPHITIAYVKKGRGKDFIGSKIFEGREIELDTVVFSPAVGNKTYFSISQDKESQFVLEKIDKIAAEDMDWLGEGWWISPSGEVMTLAEGEEHQNFTPNDVELPEGEDHNQAMIDQGWVRARSIAGSGEIALSINDLRNMDYLNDFLIAHPVNLVCIGDDDAEYVCVDYQEAVTKGLAKTVARKLKPTKQADFLPSLFQAPDNEWQFQHGGPDKEIALDPDSVWDETTWYAPCTEGKPRTKEVWRAFISMFKQPFSKKEDMTIESGQAEEWDSHYGDIWHVGDKVKDKKTGKIGLIKSINGDEVELEEIGHE